jgi:uncharacterized protein YjbI with pentapeptide repeats
MANSAQVKRLRQGVEVWNSWRAKKPSVYVDLVGANLGEASLSQADLREARHRGGQVPRRPAPRPAALGPC